MFASGMHDILVWWYCGDTNCSDYHYPTGRYIADEHTRQSWKTVNCCAKYPLDLASVQHFVLSTQKWWRSPCTMLTALHWNTREKMVNFSMKVIKYLPISQASSAALQTIVTHHSSWELKFLWNLGKATFWVLVASCGKCVEMYEINFQNRSCTKMCASVQN